MKILWISLLVLVGVIGLGLVLLGTWFLVDAKAMPDLFHQFGWLVEPTLQPTATIPPPPTVTPTRMVTITLTPTPPRATITTTLSPTPTGTKEGIVCPNTYPTHLKVGIRVYASLDPPLPNRIRQEPNTKATIIGLIKPGEEADVIDGPACAEGWIWWKIKMPAVTGWTAEGDGKDYWILPKK